jgi:hypothetical protein
LRNSITALPAAAQLRAATLRRTAKKRDDLAPFPFMEMHSLPLTNQMSLTAYRIGTAVRVKSSVLCDGRMSASTGSALGAHSSAHKVTAARCQRTNPLTRERAAREARPALA